MMAQMKKQIQIQQQAAQDSQSSEITHIVAADGLLIPVVQAQPQNVQIQVQTQQDQTVQIHITEVQTPVAHINVSTQNVAAQNAAYDNLANHNVDNQMYIPVGQSQVAPQATQVAPQAPQVATQATQVAQQQVAEGSPVDSAVASSFLDFESATNWEELWMIMARDIQNTQDDVTRARW